MNVFAGELRSLLGLQWFRAARLDHGAVPPSARGVAGFQVPATPREFEELARKAAGIDAVDDEEAAEAA